CRVDRSLGNVVDVQRWGARDVVLDALEAADGRVADADVGDLNIAVPKIEQAVLIALLSDRLGVGQRGVRREEAVLPDYEGDHAPRVDLIRRAGELIPVTVGASGR